MSSAFIPIPESSTDIINLTISPFIIVFILNSIYPLLVYLILLSNIMVNTFFNNNMYNMVHGQGQNLKKIPLEELAKYNYRGLPYIDVNTMELCWYVENN